MSPIRSEKLASLLDEIRFGYPSDEKLVEALRNLPEFAVFDERCQSIRDASVVATLPNLAAWMLRRAAIVGSETVVSDLYRFLDAEQIPFRKIMVLAGVSVINSVSLEGSIEVIPLEALPPSTWKKGTLDHFGNSWAAYRPTAAIRQHFLEPKEELHRPARMSATANDEFRDLEDVRLCMTALGPCSPLWLGSWIEAEEWVPNLANMAFLPEPLNAGDYPRTAREDWAELGFLHGRWVAMTTEEKKHLRVALSRLNSALRHRDVVNAAIDLGIAVDAVFLSGKPADRGETGLTLRLRAAHFLGKDRQSRSELSDIFSALYRLRSMAVHGGAVSEPINSSGSKPGRKFEVHELLNHGFRWVGEAIRRIIREGEPDWEGIILG